MTLDDAYRIVEEQKGSQIVIAAVTILQAELEKCKTSLLNTESDVVRGKGQMCRALISRWDINEHIDNAE